jgi:hypothetical protein
MSFDICAIFRDEAPYLQDWIEFHQIIGCEHFLREPAELSYQVHRGQTR